MSFYDDASLVLIPSGIKTSKVYSQKPTDGSGDLTFSRASDATRTNSAGLIEVVPYNFVQQSEDFATGWGGAALTIIANSTTAPNGTLTADKIYPTSTGTVRNRQQTTSQILNNHTGSIYAKWDGNTIEIFTISRGAAPDISFNVRTGAVVGTIPTGMTASIQNVGNGWYRCIWTYNAGNTDNRYYFLLASSPNSFSVTANGTDGIFFWGAQVVQGPLPLDYLPTTNRQNIPRLDYSGGATCPRLLLEPQRTNLVQSSEQFDNTGVWGAQNSATVNSNTTISPDGTQNADTINLANVVDSRVQQLGLTISNSTTYTVSCYFKNITLAAGETFVMRLVNFLSPPNRVFVFATIDLFNGSAVFSVGGDSGTGFSGSATGSVVNAGNGWYRVILTFTTGTAAATSNAGIQIIRATAVASSFYAWGAQVEVGSYASSYIPTTTAAVTRLADACNKTGISSLIGQTEGTLFVEIPLRYLNFATYRGLISVSDGTFNNGAFVFINNAGAISNQFSFECRASGSSVASLTASNLSTANIGSTYKIAAAYKANDFVFYINGVQIGSDTSGSIAGTLSRLDLGSIGYTGLSTVDRQSVNQALLFKTRLTNAQLAELTTL